MRDAVVIRHVPFEDLGILEPMLAERNYAVRYREAGLDPVDDDLTRSADLLIILGGPIGLGDLDAYPFLADEIATVKARIDRNRPVLGICLGAQVIAAALGADVAPAAGVEIGYAPLHLTPGGKGSVLARIGVTPVLHWHGDQFQIPAGAERLAETPGFDNQAFTYGPRVLALQFHLEVDHTRIERWLIGHAHELASNRLDPVSLRADARRYGPELQRQGGVVFDAWLDQIDTA